MSGIFGKLLTFLSGLRKAKSENTQFEIYSVFRQYYEDMDNEDPCYEPVKITARLCDEAIRVARQRILLSAKLRDADSEIDELECYNNLDDEEAVWLKNLLDRYIALQKERNSLMYQLTEFDRSLAHMYELEDQASDVMPQIQDAEKNQRILRHDISYLQGEKADLEFERETLEKGLEFVKRFTFAGVTAFVLVTMLLGYLYIFAGAGIFLPTTVLIVALIVVVSLLFMFRRRMTFELQLNLKKQSRAVEILNKKNVVFAYYTNFLRFAYKKYKVRNSQMLKSNLNDFTRYKQVATRLDNVRKFLYETNDEIEKFLRDKQIGIKNSVEQFATTINVENKKKYYGELVMRRQSMERELASLDARHEGIWDTLVDLSDSDRSDDRIVSTVIETYLDEVSKLFTIGDEYIGEKLQPQY